MKQPRHYYITADAAAISFAQNYTALSQKSDSEYGAVIYQKRSNAKYFAGKIRIGSSKHVLKIFFESVVSLVLFRKVAGTIHTHPKAYKTIAPNNWNCGFSYWDSYLPGLRYLCAPNGVLYKSEKCGDNTIVFGGLPRAGKDVSDKLIYPNHTSLKTTLNKKRKS